MRAAQREGYARAPREESGAVGGSHSEVMPVVLRRSGVGLLTRDEGERRLSWASRPERARRVALAVLTVMSMLQREGCSRVHNHAPRQRSDVGLEIYHCRKRCGPHTGGGRDHPGYHCDPVTWGRGRGGDARGDDHPGPAT